MENSPFFFFRLLDGQDQNCWKSCGERQTPIIGIFYICTIIKCLCLVLRYYVFCFSLLAYEVCCAPTEVEAEMMQQEMSIKLDRLSFVPASCSLIQCFFLCVHQSKEQIANVKGHF